MDFQAQQIAQLIGGKIEGNPEIIVNSFSKIEEGKAGAISFLGNDKYEHYIYETQSSVVLVSNSFVPKQPLECTLIKVDNPYVAVSKLLQIYESMKPKKTGISSLAYISESAKIGSNCYVAPFVYIGDNVTIGDNCVINPHVCVYEGCRIGNRVVLHSGVVIGADGFGFAPSENGYEKIPQIGNVIIEDDVELGANTCVDRSTMGSTIIHKGVKLDNLVQIAHNVEVGENTVMSAQVGVAGSAKIGKWCMLGGQVGVAGHITIGDKLNAGAQSGLAGGRVLSQGNATVMGYPAMEHSKFARSAAALKNLPDLVKEVNELRKKCDELSQMLDKKN